MEEAFGSAHHSQSSRRGNSRIDDGYHTSK
jgi:hypothetical protein